MKRKRGVTNNTIGNDCQENKTNRDELKEVNLLAPTIICNVFNNNQKSPTVRKYVTRYQLT